MVVVHSGYGAKAKAGGFQVKKIQNKPIEPPTATVTPKKGEDYSFYLNYLKGEKDVMVSEGKKCIAFE